MYLVLSGYDYQGATDILKAITQVNWSHLFHSYIFIIAIVDSI